MKILKKIFKFLIYVLALVFLLISTLSLYSKFFTETKEVLESAPVQMKFQDIGNDEVIAYQEINNGGDTTAVFIGGLSGWSETWQRSINVLNEELKKKELKINLLAIDLPPFGYSKSNLEKDFFRSTQAQRINSFLDARELESGIKKVIFVAHSYGAGPATEASMQNEDRVEKLVIIDGVLNIGEGNKVEGNSFFDYTNTVEFFLGAFVHSDYIIQNRLKSFVYQTGLIDMKLTKIYTKSFNTKGTSQKFSLWLRDYAKDRLIVKSVESQNYQNLKFPVRIIWGEKDTLTPLYLAEKIVAPDRKLYLLKEVGHIPMIEDHAQFDHAILNAIIE